MSELFDKVRRLELDEAFHDRVMRLAERERCEGIEEAADLAADRARTLEGQCIRAREEHCDPATQDWLRGRASAAREIATKLYERAGRAMWLWREQRDYSWILFDPYGKAVATVNMAGRWAIWDRHRLPAEPRRETPAAHAYADGAEDGCQQVETRLRRWEGLWPTLPAEIRKIPLYPGGGG